MENWPKSCIYLVSYPARIGVTSPLQDLIKNSSIPEEKRTNPRRFLAESGTEPTRKRRGFSLGERVIWWIRSKIWAPNQLAKGNRWFSQSLSPVSYIFCCKEDTSVIFREQRVLSISLMSENSVHSRLLENWHALFEWQQETCIWMWACLQSEVEMNGSW